MYDRIVFVLLYVLLIFQNVDGRNVKKTPAEPDNPDPKPNVLTYSTFGFNDVGSHDSFVPTSPDYANYLTKYKESSDKLYAPAFPSAPDSDFTSNSESLNGKHFTSGGDGQISNMLRYNPGNIYSSSNFKSEDINKNSASEVDYRHSSDYKSSPVYGTKISSNNKNTSFNGYNNTEINSGLPYQNDNKVSSFQEIYSFNENKPSYTESVNNQQEFYNYATTYPTIEIENSMKSAPVNSQSLSKFPKFVDFTNTKPYETLETENKYSGVSSKSLDTFNSMQEKREDEDHKNSLMRISPAFKNAIDNKYNENMAPKQNLDSYHGYSNKYTHVKNNLKNKKLNYNYRDEIKVKPWTPEVTSTDKKALKNALKGYEYATNFSRTSFKFDDNGPRKQFNTNIEENVPSSSNIIDFSKMYPENDYSNVQTKPNNKNVYNIDNKDELSQNTENKYNPSVDYLNKFKSFYSSIPTSSTNWGNIFKSTDYSSYKTHNPKSQYNDEENYDAINIPKRLGNYRFGKNTDSTATDWLVYSKKQSKFNRPTNEWNIDYNRFKSEEDLLGLRNHDTSHPSYLPTFQYGNEDPEKNFKTAVDKWRENYIKAKYQDTPTYDYEASEAKHTHSLNPYQIEVPHPVIVPVPQPYPVRVPIARPVAVPIIKEITVPIEKPVPYPVYKRVPYTIEKLVPVPVEKQIPVPVVKPYPVPVPQVRPVFHHSRPFRDEYDLDQDKEDIDDYFPRPESSKGYSKKPKSTRNRSRRPSRMSQQERSKVRRPQRRPNTVRERDQQRYVKSPSDYHRFMYHDSNYDDEHEQSDYLTYCKRTGNC